MNYTERNRLLDKVSIIVIMAIFVEIFLYGVDYCYTTRFDMMTSMPSILFGFGAFYLAISIFLFIKNRNKEAKNSNMIYAIEFLVLAILCPLLIYWYYPKFFGLTTNFIHQINHHYLWIAVLVYYFIRIAYAIYKGIPRNKVQKFKKNKINN